MTTSFLHALPKAELHIHIEGSLEPEYMFELAARNQVTIPYKSVEEVRQAYKFTNLQSFLDIYYAGASVLQTRADFAELVVRYAERSHQEGVVHSELFFDPQTHLVRNIPFGVFFEGLCDGVETSHKRFGMTFKLIMSFLRHLSEEDGFKTLELSKPFLSRIHGVGLDSSELGNPPEKFARLYHACKELGLKRVAHAGEEGPPSFIWDSLNILDVCRIDHGVATPKDEALLAHIIAKQIPLTVCPCSNVCLRVFHDYPESNAIDMLRKGVCVTINSDDPAYFGGYCGRNYDVLRAVGMTDVEAAQIAKNSFIASWMDDDDKKKWIQAVDDCLAKHAH